MKKMTQRMTLGLVAAAGLLMAGCGGAEGQQGSEQAQAEAMGTNEAGLYTHFYYYIRNPHTNHCLYADASSTLNGLMLVHIHQCTGYTPPGAYDARFAWQVLDNHSHGYTRLRNLAYNLCLATDQDQNAGVFGALVLKDCNSLLHVSKAHWANPRMGWYAGDTRVYTGNGVGNALTPYNRILSNANYVHEWYPEGWNEQHWAWVAWW